MEAILKRLKTPQIHIQKFEFGLNLEFWRLFEHEKYFHVGQQPFQNDENLLFWVSLHLLNKYEKKNIQFVNLIIY
jgi:hypothetical protein